MHLNRTIPASRDTQLMVTCLCDAFFDDVARATVEVLEYVGCTVDFPEDQTCCGQPAFNAGDWNASRKVVRHTAKTFAGQKPVIVPSGSCAAMIFHGALLAFEKETDLPEIKQLAERTWEVADYLVNGLNIQTWEGSYPKKVAFHKSCHSRGTRSGESALQLLQSIDGLEVLPFGEAEQCCGFGGTFSVSFPNISAAMGNLKIQHVLEQKPDVLASGDMGCMLHIGGILDKQQISLPRVHVIKILRDALVNAGKIPAAQPA
jgi:L-lactate dehydrogenase complex protein LldE